MQTQLQELDKKLDNLEEGRFITKEIRPETYEKFHEKYSSEKTVILKELEIIDFLTSNLTEYIDLTVEIASKLTTLWDSGNYKKKKTLQYLVFPDGIVYDKKKQEFRTDRINSVFSVIACLSSVLAKKKSGRMDKNAMSSALVAHRRIELLFPG